MSLPQKEIKNPKYTNQDLLSYYRRVHAPSLASPVVLEAWETDWKMRVNIYFATPELPCPSLWFFLGLCYRFFGGFSEALNMPESIKCYLPSALHAF